MSCTVVCSVVHWSYTEYESMFVGARPEVYDVYFMLLYQVYIAHKRRLSDIHNLLCLCVCVCMCLCVCL
jgi:hypothetical protein